MFFYLIVFLSGMAALIFEALWFYLTGLLLGNSVVAASMVLAGFMGGLALGSILIWVFGNRIRNYTHFYAVMQFAISISGFLLVFIIPDLTNIMCPLFQVYRENIVTLNMVRAFTVFCLMLIP